MSLDIDRVRKEVARKRKQERTTGKKESTIPDQNPYYSYYPSREELNEHEPEFYMWRDRDFKKQPSDRKEKMKQRFFIQWLGALALFLVTAMLVQTNTPMFSDARETALNLYEDEFQFAMVANWYESQFGRPLALFPEEQEPMPPEDQMVSSEGYALPASGRVAESFSENGRAVVLETTENAQVTAARGGVVIQSGRDDDWGQVVVVQHDDGTEAWYGTLDSIDVSLYDHVGAGDSLGAVMIDEHGQGGRFMFAIREDDEYIDPNEVMTFD
ncbi:stage IV sporulation protein FA [Geomicrobium halophilum]|uniref:Stage IV sporulation protein FA n=1 Tax=Geomicrobium halophilum TaxID=549000 RepID=A0A841PVU6_9BACL|nr:M23 family metallopeptidase [Geomicrobium halophilum]MBB6448353.1 stage IV sporulation protein FA [Geomicrobium halophilum]